MHPPSSPAPPRSPQWALGALAASTLLSSSATSIANVALPTLMQALDASFQRVQWVVLAYLLALTALVAVAGRIGDMFGPKRMLLAGVALFAIAATLCALAPGIELLIAARALQGAGAAIVTALALAQVSLIAPPTRAGAAMGLMGSASAVGTAIGPALGGALVQAWGWQAIFVCSALLATIVLYLVSRHLPPDRPTASARPSLNILGAVLLILTIGAYALALSLNRGAFGAFNLALLAIAAIGFVLFIAVQNRSPSPIVRFSLLAAPRVSAGLATNLLVAAIVMGTLIVGPFYLVSGLGLDATSAGLVMAIGPVVAAFAGAPSGSAVDRFGSERATHLGLGAIVIASLSLAVSPLSAGVLGYVASIALMTAGYALFQAANNAALVASAAQNERGAVSGLISLARNLGLITGASILGAVFAAAASLDGAAPIQAQAASAGVRFTFGVATLAALLAAFINAKATLDPRTGDIRP